MTILKKFSHILTIYAQIERKKVHLPKSKIIYCRGSAEATVFRCSVEATLFIYENMLQLSRLFLVCGGEYLYAIKYSSC